MDSNLRTAYILQIHKNPDQVNLFINQLISEEQADIYVHIDKRSYEKVQEKIVKSPNVKILEKSIICDWGDVSQVTTTILLLQEVVASKQNYDFVCFRSGQDLLVKDGFKDFLVENTGKIFMSFKDISSQDLGLMKINWPKITRRRFTTAHPYRVFRRLIQDLFHNGINIFPNLKYWPQDYTFYSGSQWFTLPFDVARYIIKFLEENKWYKNFFENTYTPDEWFFHTLIMNSPYKSNVMDNNLLFLKWGENFNDRNSPQNLTVNDIQIIEESNQYFARKFDEDIDNDVIEYFANKVRFCSSSIMKKNDHQLINI